MNSPRSPDQRTVSRLDGRPPRTVRVLVDQASQIRDDILNSSRTEAQTRHLIQEHIRTITEIVYKLSQDILILESQMRDRDSASIGTQNVVKGLEVYHTAGVSDLRARVVRCDVSIARLCSDVQTTFDSIQAVSQEQHEQHAQLHEKLRRLDTTIRELTSSIEHLESEHSTRLQRVEVAATQQLNGLDNRTRSVADSLQTTLQNAKMLEHGEREKLERRLWLKLDTATQHINVELEKMEQRHEKTLNELNQKIGKLEEELVKERERNSFLQQNMQSRAIGPVDKAIKRTVDELIRVKHEYRSAFQTLQDSINEVKQITETKQKLTEEHLHKEITQLRRELTHLRKIAVLI